ncbi:spermidine synthase [Candidimonas sp. SYP-B2681]|uniref:spermidine synthase n=1 Tax=Candidimonas sp. SYP-B2681 TaxID=2497686 RepID=UPI000F866BEE|nr:spermidine synthase [Candidimonas sp. SYP-B2681]RTZ47908.1 spermidine synthase [Candidimonas sp. SYP-B2681]
MFETKPWANDEPTLSELGGVRYLHFGTEWVQGAMRVGRPNELVLAYTQQMMAWLLFLEPSKTDDVGIMGLGAGSLLRYMLKNTTASVETAEWNPQVTAICRAYFRLPDSPRSVIDHSDAAVWVQKRRNIGRYMALMVDLYDAQAQGPVRDSLEFYQDCYGALSDVGIMTVNLFGDHASFPPNLENIRKAFKGQVLELPEIDAGNRVVLAFKGPLLNVTTAQLLGRAEQVEAVYGLPARRWAKALLAQHEAASKVAL